MITLEADPNNPERLLLTATVTLYLDRIMLAALSDEITESIRAQAVKDLQKNKQVKQLIAKAASEKLLKMLGAEAPKETDVETKQ